MATEATLEQELEDQLIEHRGSLAAIQDALLNDPQNQELISLCEELEAALRESEENLECLKKKRNEREIDENKCEFVAGSKCRFRHSDGRWYNGKIIEWQDGNLNALVSFLMPTSTQMQMCKFHLQKRCRYGHACRLSHGFSMRVGGLRKYMPMRWEDMEVGSRVIACDDLEGGVWREAEVEECDRENQRAAVVFVDDGKRRNVAVDEIEMRLHPLATDESSSSSDEEEEEQEDDEEQEEEEVKGEVECVRFGRWEKHTRGIASRIMAGMGYRNGNGLGIDGQGMKAPLPVKVIPANTSLDFIDKVKEEEGMRRKVKKRGGKRKREKKFAEKRRERKREEEREEEEDVFELINRQLWKEEEKKEKKEKKKSAMEERDEIREMEKKVRKLEEMAERNRKRDLSVFKGVSRKLDKVRSELAKAKQVNESNARALHIQQEDKKWLRF